jgi:hypothetical protein
MAFFGSLVGAFLFGAVWWLGDWAGDSDIGDAL